MLMLRNLNNYLSYGIDTYLVCLQLLARIKMPLRTNKNALIAAGLMLIVGKVHEYRTPRFSEMVAWAGQ